MRELDRVIGYESIKTELYRFIDIIKNPEKYKKLGAKMPRGIMLDGEPGIGKTLMAKSFIAETGLKSFVIRKDMPDGEFIDYISEVFDKATEAAPSIVLLDDLDKFANEDVYHRDAEEYVTVQACIDGVKDLDVLVVATCNESHRLPESLLRSGRFDKLFYMRFPGIEDAKKIIEFYLKDKKIGGNIDSEEIARFCEGHSCADLETVINELREEGEYSIFITGPNSYLLSGELVTKLTGRYVEFEIFTMTFDEYVGMKKMYGKPVSERMEEELDSYILEGGFPRTVQYDSLDDKRTYVKSVIDEIFEKDIKRRVQIRHKDTFNKVQTFILNNFGVTMSLNNILDELKKENVNIKRDTLNRYIQVLLDAKIIYECRRFELKSKKAIRGEQKYYLSDLSFYYINNVDNRINYGPVLENIVYQYARSLNYDVSIGRIGSFECDFIVRDNMMNYAYLQVAMTIMNSRDTEDREYRPLESIKDNYPKYVLTRNDPIQRRNGIIHMNIPKLIINEQRFA